MSAKRFAIPGEQIREIAAGRGSCFATDHITVDGKKVGFMYREAPSHESDSGWRFFSGEESQSYVDDPRNLAIYDVNTIANYDQAILPHLDAAVGTTLARIAKTDRFEIE